MLAHRSKSEEGGGVLRNVLFDTRSELAQAEAHAALDGPGWQPECRGNLGVSQLAVVGKHDDLALNRRESSEQSVEANSVLMCHCFVGHVRGSAVGVERVLAGSPVCVPGAAPNDIDSPEAHQGQ
jgi:hypothetical protein